MRMMMTVSMPVEAGNAAIQEGRMQKVLDGAMKRLKPEAAYFFAESGERTALFVFQMKDPSEIPSIAEPFFMELGADVDLKPVMDAKDLQKGLRKL